MEPITLDLQPEPANPKMRMMQRVIFLLFGIMNIIQGIISESNFRYINLVCGIVVVILALNYRRIYKPKVFTFDEEGVEGPIDKPKRTRDRWTDIAYIRAKMFSLNIVTRAGEERTLYLGNLTFAQHHEIKPRILQLAKSKGVEVRAE